MAVVTRDLLAACLIGWHRTFQESLVLPDSTYQKYCMTVPSTTNTEKHVWLGGLPAIQRWVDELKASSLRPFEYELENEMFGALIDVERRALEDDQIYGIAQKFAELGELFAELPDILFYEALAAGETALCYDGQPFFSASHSEGDSGTQSNLVNLALTSPNLKTVRMAAANFRDDKGNLRPVQYDTLTVGEALRDEATILLQSDKVVITGSTDASRGDANPNKGQFTLDVVPRITDDSWYLSCTKRKVKPMLFQDRTKPELVAVTRIDDHEVAVTDRFKYRGRRRCAVGYGKWQYMLKSQGG